MKLKLLPFLIITALVFSCTQSFEASSRENKAIEYYLKGKDQDVSLPERGRFLRKALSLSNALDTLSPKVLYSKSNVHYLLKEYDSLPKYGNLLKQNVISSKDHLSLGKYYHLIAHYHETVNSNIDSAFYFNNLSKNEFIKVKDSSRFAKRLVKLAHLQRTKSDYFGAKESLTEALKYIDTEKDKDYLANLFNELGATHGDLQNLSDAIINYKRAISTSTSHRDVLIYKNNLAVDLTKNGRYSEAIQILKYISKDSILSKKPEDYAMVLDNYSFAQWKNGNNSVEKSFFKALEIRKTINDLKGQISSYRNIGEYYSKQLPLLAKNYLDTVILLSRKLKIPKGEIDAINFLMDIAPKNIALKDRYIFLKDSMYQEELKAKTQFAHMKYSSEESNKEVLRLEVETANKQADLAKQKVQKTIFLALSGLLFLGEVFFYFILRQRHKKEKLQEVYATEKRISKKVHDELANDIYGVMTRMEHSKKFQKENTLNSLEGIYKRTRDISHETGSIDTQNFQEELKKLLSQFRNDDITIAVKGFSTIKWGGISDEKKITLHRVLNELLVNMKKHSGASVVSVAFENTKKKLRIDYSDNGKGVKTPFEKGAGLSNTENRIKNIDGTFSFESKLGKGVRINCTFPI